MKTHNKTGNLLKLSQAGNDGPFDLPEGFDFADAQSVSNYRKAVRGDLNPYGCLPMIVINSNRPASGKTRLAQLILETRYGSAYRFAGRCGKKELDRMLQAGLSTGYLLLDDVCPGELRSESLSTFLKAKVTTCRKVRTLIKERVAVKVQVVVTGNGLVLDEDLNRRSLIITLQDKVEPPEDCDTVLKSVLACIVGSAAKDAPPILSVEDILRRAESDRRLEAIVGFAKDPRKALGYRLKRFRGRQLTDSQGRAFEFGRREMTMGAKYLVRFL